jgi:hypothetical protein
MNLTKIICPVLGFLLFVSTGFSQNEKMLDVLPKTKADYISSEPSVINTIDWLENSPVNQQVGKRKQLNAKLLAWLTNSPTVTIDLNEKTTPFVKKNPELLFIFMGGWTKYSLQNAYSKDSVKCNMAGIKSSVKVYQMGNGLLKDEQMEKIIVMDSNGLLEAWVRSQLGVVK